MKQRELQITAISKMLESNIAIMTCYKNTQKDTKIISVCEKSIRESKKALRYLPTIKHDDIIDSLFRTLTVNSVQLFTIIGPLINGKQVKDWDNTENGYQEFLHLEEEAQQIAEEKKKQQIADQEAIKKAKEQGKKVDYVYKDGKMKPVVMEEDNNA